VFCLAPTNVFLALNGVSPDRKYSNEHGYCKMVIKKKKNEKGLPPSAMWREFWTSHKDLSTFLDESTLTKNIQGEVFEVHVPLVWAEPIPGEVTSYPLVLIVNPLLLPYFSCLSCLQ
jgi:hypothetical protein